jgi:hypothetical protein
MAQQAVVDLITQTEREPASETVVGGADVALMFERLARDPAVDVEKLERLIAMQERIMRHNAKAAYESQFSQMQPKIPVIDEKGRIEVKGSLRSTYAPLEDIHDVIKPILSEYGFAIRHRTEWPQDKPNIIRIVGILSHAQGHSEESVFEAPMDRSDYRTDIQSMGSTVSYGRRYTTIDLLNISTRRIDNDGQGVGKHDGPAPPEGYDAWLATLEGVADEGMKAWSLAWNKSKPEYTKHLAQTAPKHLAAIKTRAASVRA